MNTDSSTTYSATAVLRSSEQGARDFYATDEDYGSFGLRCVPAGGFAPKRTHFVARVHEDGSLTVVDRSREAELRNWLAIEQICHATALAAEEGRFCFTNGNTCVYVDGTDLVTAFIQPVSIDREPLTSERAQRYLNSSRPHRSLETASSLRAHAASKMEINI